MIESQSEFITHVTRNVAGLLNTILREDGLQLFRRNPQVVIGHSEMLGNGDFHLDYSLRTGSENDKGSFNYKTAQDRFIVFRTPSRMTVSFLLSAKGLNAQLQSRSYDRLMTYFFDHRAIDPFVPEAFKKFPPLYERLLAGKAELKVNEVGLSSRSNNGSDQFLFSFDYVALYHSGNPLREELTAKSRVVEMVNENSERSVL